MIFLTRLLPDLYRETVSVVDQSPVITDTYEYVMLMALVEYFHSRPILDEVINYNLGLDESRYLEAYALIDEYSKYVAKVLEPWHYVRMLDIEIFIIGMRVIIKIRNP